MIWLSIETTNPADEQLLESSRVMSLKKVGQKVTFVTDQGNQYVWRWDGTVATWGKLMVALGVDEVV